jgi:hypothetical protein
MCVTHHHSALSRTCSPTYRTLIPHCVTSSYALCHIITVHSLEQVLLLTEHVLVGDHRNPGGAGLQDCQNLRVIRRPGLGSGGGCLPPQALVWGQDGARADLRRGPLRTTGLCCRKCLTVPWRKLKTANSRLGLARWI